MNGQIIYFIELLHKNYLIVCLYVNKAICRNKHEVIIYSMEFYNIIWFWFLYKLELK